MSDQDRFFQFPLRLLACGNDDRVHTLTRIVYFCVVDQMDQFDGTDTERFEKSIRLFGITSHAGLKQVRQEASAAREFAFGTSGCKVRIKAAILFDCMRDETPDWEEFRVLCAVYSAIGSKPFARPSRRAIVWRSAGAVSEDDYNRNGGLPLVGDKAVRNALDRLWLRKFFARCTWHKRVTFYSHRVNDDDALRAFVRAHYGDRERMQLARQADVEAFNAGANLGPTLGQVGANIISGANRGPTRGQREGQHNRNA